MKKLFQLGAIFFGLLTASANYAQNNNIDAQNQGFQYSDNQYDYNDNNQQANYGRGHWGRGYPREWNNSGYGSRDWNNSSQGYGCEQGACGMQSPPEDHPCEDKPTGDCWCLYCHYEPCYYTVQRCIEEPKYCKKKCCRYVPRQYEIQKCRYVPQYYCETVCRYEPEYYYTDECKMCKRMVCDRKCKYVPKYYWKHVCGDNSCTTPCPTR